MTKEYKTDEETRLRAKAWYAENREAKKAYDREYREKNRAKINAYAAEWRLNNNEHQLALEKKRRDENPKYAETTAKWRAENADRLKAYEAERRKTEKRKLATKIASEAWKKAHPEERRNHVRNRRAKLRDGGVLSKDIEKTLMAAQGGLCAVCKCCIAFKFQLDHIVPVARGGRNEDDNVQLLCPPCNQSKGARPMDEFIRSRAAV